MKDPIRVTTLTRIWRSVRRAVSRNEWAVRLLGLQKSPTQPLDRGLILIQIDGLSQTECKRAISEGRMPFLSSLIEKEHYVNHAFYSGLPSSTPAVQGELYYGKKTAVPAFGFRDHRTGRLERMFDNQIASEVQDRLGDGTIGLLKNGSSYCNNYGGGAKEVHFCATSFGWDEFLRTVNPIRIALVMILNSWMFVRTSALMVVEFFLATFDFFRGIFSGRQFWQELTMIPARVIVVALLRELVTTGTCYDAARGLPIVHLNLLGFDEHAHRRGPRSRYAHWTLHRIDKSIKRIWKAADRSARREYDVWVFSDHGQETTRPYQLKYGRLIQRVVADCADQYCLNQDCGTEPTANAPKHTTTRADWLGFGPLVSLLFGEQDFDMQSRSPHVQTVTSGPLGFVYFQNASLINQKLAFAETLVREKHVPMIVLSGGKNRATVVTPQQTYQLPMDAIEVFGADHPFLEDVSTDLIELANHVDAGDLLLVGWTHEKDSISFVLQNGAHAGPGIDETRGFACLPCDAPLPESHKRYIRPRQLREAALRFLGRTESEKRTYSAVSNRTNNLRLMTYNVHGCVGMDGLLSPERIARVISQSGANIICLQEVDVFRQRSGNLDQAHQIAKHLEMDFHFHPAWHIEEEKFGNAIFTRFPLRVVKGEGLHQYKDSRSRRSALWTEVSIDSDTTLQVISTHLSIYPKEQSIQAQELLDDWVQPATEKGPVILCGDFNARPASAAFKMLDKQLNDVENFDDHRRKATYFSPRPVTRIDHIFLSDQLRATSVQVIRSRLAQTASDHLPLVANIRLD